MTSKSNNIIKAGVIINTNNSNENKVLPNSIKQ